MARMPAPRRLTMKEVARAAGVSTQTVSRVLNNRPDVAPATLARVQQVIADTGYAPNAFARSLTQGRSHTLGVIAFGLDLVGPAGVLTGIDQQAAELGYSISLHLVHAPDIRDASQVIRSLAARQVDGIVWAVPEVGNNRAWSVAPGLEMAVPLVLLSGMDETTSLPSIVIDNRAIGRLATEHLLTGGARRIGILTGPRAWWESAERVLGWREALAAHGLAPVPGLVEIGDWKPDSGRTGLRALLEREPELDAVFASNDQMALGVLHAAHELGRRVPEDLSVVGVDDIAEAAHFWPSLTTVHQPLRRAGALAVALLDGAINQRHDDPAHEGPAARAVSTVLQPDLVIRDSSRQIP